MNQQDGIKTQLQRCRDLDASISSGIFTTVRSARHVPGQINNLVSRQSQWVAPVRMRASAQQTIEAVTDDVDDENVSEHAYDSDSRIDLPITTAPIYTSSSATATSIDLPITRAPMYTTSPATATSISLGKRKSVPNESPIYPQFVTQTAYSATELGIIATFTTATTSDEMVRQLFFGAGSYRKSQQIRKKLRGVHLLTHLLI